LSSDTNLDEASLANLERLAEAATPGEWSAYSAMSWLDDWSCVDNCSLSDDDRSLLRLAAVDVKNGAWRPK
jgi:hypothetical protein